MSRNWKPRRPTVELKAATAEVRPSKIRRQPPAAPAPAQKAVQPFPSEREIWIVAVGVILFAIAIAGLTFGISDITGH